MSRPAKTIRVIRWVVASVVIGITVLALGYVALFAIAVSSGDFM